MPAAALRDSLGFLMPALSEGEAAARLATQARATKCSKAWAGKNVPLDPSASATSSAAYHALLFDPALKQLVRQGIPTELRPTMWYWLSGGYSLATSAQSDYYSKLASSTGELDDAAIMAIEEGLDTKLDPIFRTNLLFQTNKVRNPRAAWGTTSALGAHAKHMHLHACAHNCEMQCTCMCMGAMPCAHAWWSSSCLAPACTAALTCTSAGALFCFDRMHAWCDASTAACPHISVAAQAHLKHRSFLMPSSHLPPTPHPLRCRAPRPSLAAAADRHN